MDMIQTEDGPKPLRRTIPAGWENALGAAFNHRAESEAWEECVMNYGGAPRDQTPWPFPTHDTHEAELMALLRSRKNEPRIRIEINCNAPRIDRAQQQQMARIVGLGLSCGSDAK